MARVGLPYAAASPLPWDSFEESEMPVQDEAGYGTVCLQWRKGFLSDAPPPKKSTLRRKANALPDDYFLPTETYELADDDGNVHALSPAGSPRAPLSAAHTAATSSRTAAGDTVDPRIYEISSPDEAHEFSVEFSRSHCNLYNTGMIKITPETNMQFCEDIRVVQHNRKFFGHHDGGGHGGQNKTMLLPSGIVLNYLEWGDEAAPPIVLLHDICGCCHEFDEIARPLAEKYRVLALDMRGHGESSHSPKHLYGIEHLVEDVHELVVRLSLNGRDWGGAWTRPWVMIGRGIGAGIATAYAARHPGRCAGLVLWDFDPEWGKDRLNFYPYQAAHFANQLAIASFFNDKLQLQEDGKYLSITFVNRAHHLNVMEDNQGCEFNMDHHFFVSDYNSGIAWAMLREAATKTKILLCWSQNSREWSYGRMNEIADSLRQAEHRDVSTATIVRGTTIDPESKHAVEDFAKLYKSSAGHFINFADAIDREARQVLKASGRARYEKVSDAEIAQKAAEKESNRMAAREAAEAMSAEDKPISMDDDLLD